MEINLREFVLVNLWDGECVPPPLPTPWTKLFLIPCGVLESGTLAPCPTPPLGAMLDMLDPRLL